MWDRLPAHRSKLVKAALRPQRGSQSVLLPGYAPKLNPVENLWSYLKTNPLANLDGGNADALVTVARSAPRSVQRSPSLLEAFVRHCPLRILPE